MTLCQYRINDWYLILLFKSIKWSRYISFFDGWTDGWWKLSSNFFPRQIENADGHFYKRALFLKNLIWEHFRSTSSALLHGNMFESITCPLSRETYYFRNCWFRFSPDFLIERVQPKRVKNEWVKQRQKFNIIFLLSSI